MKHHKIPKRLKCLSSRTDDSGFSHEDEQELDNIDRTMTTIRIQGEKNLFPPPSPFKHTSIGKHQVTIIRLLQTLQHR